MSHYADVVPYLFVSRFVTSILDVKFHGLARLAQLNSVQVGSGRNQHVMSGSILADMHVEASDRAAVRVREPECSQTIRCDLIGISVRLWLTEMQTYEVLETAARARHRPKARRS